MIQIDKLNDRQKKIIDTIWHLESMEDVEAFVQALPTVADRYDALSMVSMLVVDSIELEEGLEAYADAAKAAIDHANGR